VRVEVTPIAQSDPRYSAFSGLLTNKALLTLYEIKLVDTLTGKVYELPAGQVVTVTIGSLSLADAKNIVMAHKKADGSIEYINATVNGNAVSFTASSFSLYGVAADKAAAPTSPVVPDTGDNFNWIYLWISLAASAGLIVVMVTNKRKRFKAKMK